MTRSRLGDYLTYGLGGAVLGTGAGAAGSGVLQGSVSPTGTLAGTSIGLGAGLLTAYLRNKERKDIQNMSPGWYLTEQPLYRIPDIGDIKVRHSSHTVIVPREEAQELFKKKEWKGTDHYDFTNNQGQKLTAFQIATHMDSRKKPWRMLTFSRMQIPFREELNPTKDWEPLSKAVEVPLKKNVKLTDVLKRLKKIETNVEEGKAPMYTLLPGASIKELGKGGMGSCHDVTNAILRSTEDLHNLQSWKPEGFFESEYERPEIRKARILEKCRNELSKSYLAEVLKHTLGGAVGGGIVGAGIPIVSSRGKSDMRDIKGMGITGAGLGSLAGTLVGLGSATFKRLNAQRQLNKLMGEAIS